MRRTEKEEGTIEKESDFLEKVQSHHSEIQRKVKEIGNKRGEKKAGFRRQSLVQFLSSETPQSHQNFEGRVFCPDSYRSGSET